MLKKSETACIDSSERSSGRYTDSTGESPQFILFPPLHLSRDRPADESTLLEQPVAWLFSISTPLYAVFLVSPEVATQSQNPTSASACNRHFAGHAYPINPEYYYNMSQLLDTLIQKRRKEAIEYEKYLAEIVALTKQAANPAGGASYPKTLNTSARRALYDNLGKNETLANDVDYEILAKKKDDWRSHKIKEKEVRYAIQGVLHDVELTDKIFEIAKHQRDY